METYVNAVVKSVTVDVSQQRAFDFFTHDFGTWWPMEGHRILEGSTSAAIEPRAGGRWWEFGGPEGECDWGRVIAYEPPDRLLLAWQLDHDWTFDPEFLTEVEVRFVPVGDSVTRVELEHRNLERFREAAAGVRASLDGDNGWSGVLGAYARRLA